MELILDDIYEDTGIFYKSGDNRLVIHCPRGAVYNKEDVEKLYRWLGESFGLSAPEQNYGWESVD